MEAYKLFRPDPSNPEVSLTPMPGRTKCTCAMCDRSFWPRHANRQCCSRECEIARDKRKQKNSPGSLVRLWIFDRDKFRCAYCGRTSYEDEVRLVLGHIVPSVRGGEWTAGNLLTICHTCNVGQRSRRMWTETELLAEARERCERVGMNPDALIRNSEARLALRERLRPRAESHTFPA